MWVTSTFGKHLQGKQNIQTYTKALVNLLLLDNSITAPLPSPRAPEVVKVQYKLRFKTAIVGTLPLREVDTFLNK